MARWPGCQHWLQNMGIQRDKEIEKLGAMQEPEGDGDRGGRWLSEPIL